MSKPKRTIRRRGNAIEEGLKTLIIRDGLDLVLWNASRCAAIDGHTALQKKLAHLSYTSGQTMYGRVGYSTGTRHTRVSSVRRYLGNGYHSLLMKLSIFLNEGAVGLDMESMAFYTRVGARCHALAQEYKDL